MGAVREFAYTNSAPVTPSDTVSFSPCQALLVAAAGATFFYVDTYGGQAKTPISMGASGVLPLAVTRVYSSGATGSPTFTLLW